MTARGVDFLEDWMAKNVTKDPVDAGLLAAKLVAEATMGGFTLADLELDQETVESYIREAMVHLAEPGTPGD